MRKLSVSLIVLALTCSSLGMFASNNVQAAFVQPLSNSGLPATFVAYDTAWNEAGTMAVVVGFDSDVSPGTNAYAYYPNNDTYWPIANDGYNQQRLHAIDYFNQPIYDWPRVLLVDADFDEDNLISFYQNTFQNCRAYVDTWEVWEGGSWVDGKPTAADMAPYDLVVWIPSRYMMGWNGGGDALNFQDTLEISQYLSGGGNFFLANSAFSDWHSFGGPGDFTYAYLAINYLNAYGSSYEYGAQPYPGDSVFGGLGFGNEDWWSFGWAGQPTNTDIFVKSNGQYCFQCADGGSNWENTGVRYDSGTFKTIYFGFPLEVLMINYAQNLMQAALDWFTSTEVIDQMNDHTGNSGFVGVGSYPLSPWAQSFVPTADHISSVEFYMYQDYQGMDYIEIEIFEDSGGMPGPSGITYGTIDSGMIPVGGGNAGWVECSFVGGGGNLLPGFTYWIVCTRYDVDSNQYWLVDYDQAYANGNAMHDNGGWAGLSFDFLFKEHSSSAPGQAPQSISINPAKDNTMYSDFWSNSNGVGDYIMAGTNGMPDYRRALMEFDIAGMIPRYSTITSVTLSLYCSNVYTSSYYTFNLAPVYTEWGESYSNAPDWEEYGTAAQTGDATWQYAKYTSDSWMSNGGDFGPSSASTPVGGMSTWYSWTSQGMVNDVQGWLDYPAGNHGWELLGEEGSLDTMKWFNSKDNANTVTRPTLQISYIEPTVIGYQDVFWIAGDTFGPTPTGTCYKLVPSEGMSLHSMNNPMGGDPQFFTVAVDHLGNPLCGGQFISYMYYYDGEGWFSLTSPTDLSTISFKGLDYNPNDHRFYATGMDYVFYSDAVPLEPANSKVYQFNHFPDFSGSLDGQLAWNEVYNYGIFGGDTYLVKIWPYGEYANGTARYQVLDTDAQKHYFDCSWDTDGWNELALLGSESGQTAYWRYYHTNPQVLDGYLGGAGTFYTGAMKPPSSPKWLFIPLAGASLRLNIEEKDQSGEITVSSEFPHIFAMGMWKQSDISAVSTLNTQVEGDSTYTFAFEVNYTRSGMDYLTDLEIYLTGWFDFGNAGMASNPGDPTWTSDNYRTCQFNISLDPSTNVSTLLYPVQLAPAGAEFAIHSSWQDPASYGIDGSHHRFYVNVTFGPQTIMASGAGNPPVGGNIWDKNFALNNGNSWDIRLLMFDTAQPSARNTTWDEFGVQRYASVAASGSPSGSIPPGAIAMLGSPTTINYSSNTQYKLNVSVPHLYKDGIVGPTYIAAGYVQVWNDHTNADGTNSNISAWTPFNGPNLNQIIWGTTAAWIPPVGSGTESAGPMYSDYTAAAAPELFEVTEVWWTVEVPVGTPEGIYRATITITLWS